MWSEVCAISGADNFQGFAADFKNHLKAWRDYFDCVEPHLQRLPDKWDTCLNSFQKLCVLRCLRVDKVTDGVMAYVIEKMGQRFVVPRLLLPSRRRRDSSPSDEVGGFFFEELSKPSDRRSRRSRARRGPNENQLKFGQRPPSASSDGHGINEGECPNTAATANTQVHRAPALQPGELLQGLVES